MMNINRHFLISTHELLEAFRIGLLHIPNQKVWLKGEPLKHLISEYALVSITHADTDINEYIYPYWLPISRISEIAMLADTVLLNDLTLGIPNISQCLIRRIPESDALHNHDLFSSSTERVNSSATEDVACKVDRLKTTEATEQQKLSELNSNRLNTIIRPTVPTSTPSVDNREYGTSTTISEPLYESPAAQVSTFETESASHTDKKLSNQTAEFNRLLGLFAFSRTAGTLFTKTHSYQQVYPAWAELTLKLMSKSDSAFAQSTSKSSFTWVDELWGNGTDIPVPVQVIRDWARSSDVLMINNEAVRQELLNIRQTRKEDFPLQVDNALKYHFHDEDWLKAVDAVKKIPQEHHPSAWAALLTLLRYGNRSTDHPDHVNLKHQLARDWPEEYGFHILAAMGYFYGYEHLHRCEDRLHQPADWVKYLLRHPLNKKINLTQPEIKFTLACDQERRLIESVFMHCFSDGILAEHTHTEYFHNHTTTNVEPECFMGMRYQQENRAGWNSYDFDWLPQECAAKIINKKSEVIQAAWMPKFNDNYHRDAFWNELEGLSLLLQNAKGLLNQKNSSKRDLVFSIIKSPLKEFLVGIFDAIPEATKKPKATKTPRQANKANPSKGGKNIPLDGID